MRSARRLAALAAAASLALLIPVAAHAAPAPAYGDSVVAKGNVVVTGVSVDFDASVRSGPNGENPVGYLSLPYYGINTTKPTCMNVQGNQATNGYDVTGTIGFPDSGFLTVVTDNGPGHTDYVNYYHGVDLPLTSCPAPSTIAVDQIPLVSGDIVVTDVPPLPTSKHQCKQGGWRSYPGRFKNQGDCVSFVQTGR